MPHILLWRSRSEERAYIWSAVKTVCLKRQIEKGSFNSEKCQVVRQDIWSQAERPGWRWFRSELIASARTVILKKQTVLRGKMWIHQGNAQLILLFENCIFHGLWWFLIRSDPSELRSGSAWNHHVVSSPFWDYFSLTDRPTSERNCFVKTAAKWTGLPGLLWLIW
jgi:hypothetical protein